MGKRRRLIFGGIGLLLLVSVFSYYWFYAAEPSVLPKEEQLLAEMNDIFPEIRASNIQEIVSVDKRHLFVPFISQTGDYGVSYWSWKKHKWSILSMDSKGEPEIWKVNIKDPSTFYLVWNLDPNDRLSYMEFYFLRNREYSVSEGVENYQPKVELKERINLEEKTYGAMLLKKEWASLINSWTKVQSRAQPNPFFDSFFPDSSMYFGWIPYGRNGQETFPASSVNGNGYQHSYIDLGIVMMVNEEELEGK